MTSLELSNKNRKFSLRFFSMILTYEDLSFRTVGEIRDLWPCRTIGPGCLSHKGHMVTLC